MFANTKIKSKLARKVVLRKYQPSNKTFDNEEQQNLEQAACEKLKEESYYGFHACDNDDEENPFLRRNLRFEKAKTEIKPFSVERGAFHNTSLQKSKVKSNNRTLPIVRSSGDRLNNKSKIMSASPSPRKKLPLNLTEYVIIDSAQQTISPIKFSAHFLQQKYIKALSELTRKRQTPKSTTIQIKRTLTSLSPSCSGPKKNKTLQFKQQKY